MLGDGLARDGHGLGNGRGAGGTLSSQQLQYVAAGRVSQRGEDKVNSNGRHPDVPPCNLKVALYPLKNDSDYYRLSLDASKNGFFGGVGYEVLGHDSTNNKGFATPLATLHAQNGWADMFLSTPSEGLKDLTFKLGYKSKGFGKLMAVYHDYKADESSASNDDIGSEIDVVYAKPLTKNIKLVLKMADFRKGDVSSYNDTKKYWAMINYKF